MKKISETVTINAPAETVFGYVDDINNTGWHMMENSMPLMGSKLNLEILSENKSGLGATYRWYGKVLGLTVDFSETVTKWVLNKERVWHTIGFPKIIIMSNYEMRFLIEPLGQKTHLISEISYDLPNPLFWKFLGFLLAGWYSQWCLKNMTKDTKDNLEKNQRSKN